MCIYLLKKSLNLGKISKEIWQFVASLPILTSSREKELFVTMTTLFSQSSLFALTRSDHCYSRATLIKLFSLTVFSASEALLSAKGNGSLMNTSTELSKIISPLPSVYQTSRKCQYSTRDFCFVGTCQAFLLWIQLDWSKSKVTVENLSFLQIHSLFSMYWNMTSRSEIFHSNITKWF